MSNRAEDVKVGILVIVSIALLVTAVIVVNRYSPFRTHPHAYKARFNYVGGLTQGSVVRFGGLAAGRVENIRVTRDGDSVIEVSISVDPETPIKQDSQAAVTSLGLLGENYVEISLGSPSTELLPSGEYLQTRQYPGLPEIFAKVDVAMVDAQKLIRDLDLQINRISAKADTLLTDIDKAFNDENQKKLASILGEIDELFREASPELIATLEELHKASTKIEPLLASVDQTVKHVDKVVGNIDSMVVENRPEIRKTLQDLDRTLLDTRATILDMQTMLQYNRRNIDLLLENMAASSENVKELTDTVKQYPFSLIRMPSKKPRIPPEIPK